MIQQNIAQIYKVAFRGVTSTENCQRFSTFNFENYQDDSRKPFGSLGFLNEEILAPKQKQTTVLAPVSDIFILPIFGGIEYKDNLGNNEFIRVEQIQHIIAKKGMEFELSNPFEEDNVSYLQIGFDFKNRGFQSNFKPFEFGLTQKNELVPLFEIEKNLGFIGIFEGRKDGFYALKEPTNGVFVFVINGAFEVENRLLEPKDGLRLEQIERIEWEALSENAILLVLEIELKQDL